MIDMDGFKKVNDVHGHGVGDDLLRSVARAIRSCCRPYDVSARFGGDEFAVILVQVEGADAVRAAGRLMTAINGVLVQTGSESVRASASGGLVEADEMPPGFLVADLLAAADAALYQAKREGRQRLAVGSAPSQEPGDS
jgi:diguanylate cyclase (GGDEF)-like protein